MQLNIKEAKECNIVKVDSSINIDLSLFDSLISKSYEDLIIDMLNSNKIVNCFNMPNVVLKMMRDCILERESIDNLKEVLLDNQIPIFSLILGIVYGYNQKYQYLKEIENAKEVFIFCSENNFLNALNLAKTFKGKVVLSCHDISLQKYKCLLESYGIDNLVGLNVYIDYQMNNTPILVLDVYKTSCIVNSVVDEINRYSLSDLEKVMYVYDTVKYRLYEDDTDNINNSRDLDKVLTGNKIVCMGYSNLFNAILYSLNIRVIPATDLNIRHQRSIAYIKDSKYNIDGLYVFDPTWDKRTSIDDTGYIDRYDYFLMPIERSKKSFYSDIDEILDIGRDKIKEIIDGEDTSSIVCILDRLNMVFSLVDSSYVVNDKYYVVEDILSEYDKVIDKCYSKEMDYDYFTLLLFNVRSNEYVNGVIDEIDINSIKDTSLNRCIGKKRVRKK